MKSRAFTSHIDYWHKRWFSQVLGFEASTMKEDTLARMQGFPTRIDFLGPDNSSWPLFAVELKSRWTKKIEMNGEEGIKCPPRFVIHENQREDYEEAGKEYARRSPRRSCQMFWLFNCYGFVGDVGSLDSSMNLGNRVFRRDAYFVPFDWAEQLEVARPKSGPYRYVTQSIFPPKDYQFLKFDFSSGDFDSDKNRWSRENRIFVPEACLDLALYVEQRALDFQNKQMRIAARRDGPHLDDYMTEWLSQENLVEKRFVGAQVLQQAI